MRRPHRLLLLPILVALAVIPPGPGWTAGVADHGDPQAVVISGHRGAVLAMDRDESRGLLFTAGADGTVKIWDSATRSLVRSLMVTSLQAAMIAVSPAGTRFAVLASDTLQSFSLEVWDWQKGEMVFKIPLSDQPLFIRYSSSGRYLLYGLPRWDSLRVVNASDGSAVTFHPEGFGMAGFAALSRSEKILMTYRLTGVISYWDLASGKLVEDLQTVALLSHIRLSPDLSFLAGSTDSEIVLVDVSSGRVEARAPLTGVTSLDISPQGDEIACIAENGTLSRWAVSPGGLARKADPPGGAPHAALVRFTPAGLILGSGDGELASLSADGTEAVFPGDERAVITGMAVRGASVAVATSSWIKVFTGGLADAARQGAGSAGSVAAVQAPNPFNAPVDLTFLDDDTLLVYQTGSGPGAYGILDLKAGSFRPAAQGGSPQDSLGSPIIEAQSDGSRCLLLAQDGTLRVIDLPSGATHAQMWRPGSMWAALDGGNAVVVGGQPGATEPGSLVRINMDTGETDPIPTRNQYTYEVLFDAATGVLYSLGVDPDGTTNLLAHTGKDFQTQSVVESTPGDHLSASLCFDGYTGTLYTSLGRERISRYRQGSLTRLPAPAFGTIGLFCGNGLLYSLNRDSSVSLIDPGSGQNVAELSVFPDGGWALVMPDGKYAVSAGSQSRISVLQGDTPTGKAAPDGSAVAENR
jgi:WD40 repeat protein